MTIEGTAVLHGSTEARGSWPTSGAVVFALLPLIAFVAIALALDAGMKLPLPPGQIAWFVLGPLVLLYPVVAAVARVHAYAPTTVLVTAAVAPALALAARLLVDPIARDAAGKAVIDVTLIQERALPPAVAAVAVFLAVEIASAGMRRGIVLGIAASLVSIGLVAAAAVAVLQMTGIGLPALS